MSRASEQSARDRCLLHGWRIEERNAGHAMNAHATAKRAYRGTQRGPWFGTWGEVEDWELAQPKESDKQ